MIGETGRKLSRLTLLLGLTATVMFAGCDTDRTGRGRNGFANNTTFLSQGQVQAGPVNGATLVAFEIRPDGTVGQTIGEGSSDQSGSYTLALQSGFADYTGPVLLTATGGRYRDEGTGNDVVLSGTLRAVIPNFTGGSTDPDNAARFNVTPLTTLAARLAESAQGGFTEANITAANAAVNAAFGGGFDILSTKLADPGSSSTDTIPQDEADYTAAVAGISFAAANANTDPNQYLNMLSDDISDGKLDGRDATGRQIFADDGVVRAIARGTNEFLSSANNIRGVMASSAFLQNLANLDGNIARNTVPGVDRIAPVVTERFPSPGQGGVFRNARVFVRFNEELDANTVNASTVSVSNGTATLTGAVSYDAASRTIAFTPSTDLPDSAQISVNLTTGITDMQGNALARAETFAFTTGSNNSPDAANFRATVSFTPGGVSSTVSTNTAFVVSFDRALNPASIFASGIVDLRVNGNAVPFAIGYDLGATRFSIIPVFPLDNSATATINVTGSAQSAFGDLLGSDAGTSVTTDAPGTQDQTAPTVVAVSPADASTGASASDSVRVTFSEGMNAATVIAATQLSLGANPVATNSTYSSSSNSIVLTPTSPLQAGQTYSVSVSTSAADEAGNAIATAFSSTFQVAQPAFSIATSTLPNGIINQTYSQSLQVVGGTGPFSFALASGDQLPAGLQLDAQNPGVISGVPSTAGTTSFTIIVTDSAQPAATARQQISITIDSMATQPTVSFVDTASTTMNEATQSFPVTLVLNTPSPITQAVSVDVIDTLSGTAAAGTDYVAFGTNTVTFPANSGNGLTVTVNIAVTNDNLFEGNETIVLSLGNISGGPNAVLGGASSHVVTVVDDGPFPDVALSSGNVLNVNEGSAGTVTVELTNPTINTVTVPFTVGGVALAGTDHDLMAGQFVIAAGTTSASINFNALSDILDEDDMESLTVTLQNPVNGNANLVNPSTQDFQIVDQTPLPEVSINDLPSIDEETAGAASFTVTISPPMGRTNTVTTVDYMVADVDTADGFDITSPTSAGPQTLTFVAGQLSDMITVPVLNDDRDEDDESFTVTLMNPVNVTISATDGVGEATIIDGDAAPEVELTMTNQTFGEGVGTVTVTARLANGAVSGKDVTIPFTVDASGTAVNPDDHDFASGSFPVIPGYNMAAGSTEASVSFNVVDDMISEQTETISVTLGAPTNATLLAGGENQVISITDNEGVPTLELTVVDSTGTAVAGPVGENVGSLTVRGTLNRTSSSDVNFDLVVGAGTTSNPADFADASVGNDGVRVYVARNGTVDAATVAAYAPFTGAPFVVDQQVNKLNLRNNEGIAISTSGDMVQAGDVEVNGSVVPSIRIVRNVSNRAEGANFDEIAGDVTIVGATNTMLVQPKGLALSSRHQRILVADLGGRQILVFDLQTTGGDVAPVGRLDLSAITGVIGSPWDCDYDAASNALFIAMTDGSVLVYDNVFDAAGALTANATPDRAFAIGSSSKVSVNCHGIQYVGGSVDRLIVSDVGAPGDNMDGQIFVVDSALSAGAAPAATLALAPASLTVNTGANVRLGNPVDVAFDGADLYVAEKTSDAGNNDFNSVLVYEDFLSNTNSGSIAPTARIPFADGEGPESVAVDFGARRDFNLLGRSLTIPAGQTTVEVSFNIDDDVRNEADETIIVDFMSIVGASGGTTNATISITDNDALPVISVAAQHATEGNEVVFVVSLDAASGRAVSADFSTMDGTAVSPDDFAAVATTTLNFAEGQTSQRIAVATVDDALNEAVESFNGVLAGNPTNADEGTLVATANINDNDNLPVLNLSASSATTGEGASVTYTVDLVDTMGAPATSGQTITVDIQVMGNSATFTAGDFTLATNPQTLTFNPGVMSQSITVAINADGVNEPTETYNVVLSGVSATAVIGTGSVTTTINDADTLTASIAATSAGVEGGSDVVFTVSVNPVSEQTLTYDVAVSGNGTDGVEPTDFTAPSQLVVTPGSNQATLTLGVVDDSRNEAVEGLAVDLTLAGTFEGLAVGSDSLNSTSTVSDNANGLDNLNLTLSATAGAEGGADVVFTATLSPESEQTVEFTVLVSGDGADPVEVGNDLSAAPSSITFMPLVTSQDINLTPAADGVNEDTEGVRLQLTLASSTIGYASGVVAASTTVADNDPTTATLVELSAGDENGSTAAVFQVQLSVASEQTIEFTYDANPTGANSAAKGTDFDLPPSTVVTVAAGTTTSDFNVLVNADGNNEANETFQVSLVANSAFNNLTNGVTPLTLDSTIADNNPLTISISANAMFTPANEDSTTNQEFSVNLSIPTEQEFTVNYMAMAPMTDAAVEGVDYQLPTTSVDFTIPMGQTTRSTPATFSTNLVTDSVNERDESYMIKLTTVTGQTNNVSVDMAMDTATATILNDDTLTVTVARVGNGSEAGAAPAQFSLTLNTTSAFDSEFSLTLGSTNTVPELPPLMGMVAVSEITVGTDAMAPATVVIPAGSTSATVDVTVVDDMKNENDEGLTLTAAFNNTNAVDFNIAPLNTSVFTAAALISDNDDIVATVSVAAGPFMEGASGSSNPVTFTVAIDKESEQAPEIAFMTDVTAGMSSTVGNAVSDDDFDAQSGSVTFMGASQSETVDVTLRGDDDAEQNETFRLVLTGVNGTPRGVSIGMTSEAVATITDDDDATVDLATTANVGEDAGSVTYTMTLSGPKSDPVTAQFNVDASSTATDGRDSSDLNAPGPFAAVYVNENTATPAVKGFAPDLAGGSGVTLSPEGNEGLAIGRDGRLYVASDAGGAASIRVMTNVSDRAATPAFDVLTDSIIRGASTELVNPKGLDVDTRRELIFVADFGASKLLVFKTSDSNDVAPTASIDLGARPWDLDYDPFMDRMYVAMTNGVVMVFDNFAASYVDAQTGSGTADRVIRPTVGGSFADDNLHGIVYHEATDTLVVSGVGTASLISTGTSPGTLPGAIYVIQSASSADSDTAVAYKINSTSMAANFVNPVDLTSDGKDLYVAEKVTGFVGRYNDFFTTFTGNPGTTVDQAPDAMVAASAPESVVIDSGKRRDYVFNGLAPVTLTIMPGDTSATVSVPVVDDTRSEGTTDETLVGMLSMLTGDSTAGTLSATANIADNDGQPTLTVTDVTIDEGDSGNTMAFFKATLDRATDELVLFEYATADGTATVADNDYVAVAGGVSGMELGQTFVFFAVEVVGDTTDEADETFSVQVSNVQLATFGGAANTGTIKNDDMDVEVSIANAADTTEGGQFSFDITISPVSGVDVMVDWATTMGGTADAADFTAVMPTQVTIPAGSTSVTVTVDVAADSVYELDQTVEVALSNPVNAGISATNGTAVGVIKDNNPVSINIDTANPVTVVEGDANNPQLVFNATLDVQSEVALAVEWTTNAMGTATANVDYTEVTGGMVNFTPMTSSQTFAVTVLSDTINEVDQTVGVQLGNVAAGLPGVTVGANSSHVGTISDDDMVTVNIAKTADGAEGGANVQFTVTLDKESEQNLTFNVTSAGSGVDPVDAGDTGAIAATVAFAAPGMAGSTSQLLDIAVTDDGVNEATESVTVSIAVQGTPVRFANGTLSATADITDNDAITLAFAAGTSFMLDEGTVMNTITVERSGPSEQTISFSYNVGAGAGNASPAADFATDAGTVTFMPANGSQTVTLTLVDDMLDEVDETFELSFSGLATPGVTFAATMSGMLTQTVTIVDNDAEPTLDLTLSAATVAEGASVDVTVTMSAASGRDVMFDIVSNDGAMGVNGARGSDYSDIDAMGVTIAAGSTTSTVSLSATDDDVNEAAEDLTVMISGFVNATPGANVMQTLTITASDPVMITIDNPTVDEVNNGANAMATFTVSLDRDTEQVFTMAYTPAAGTAQDSTGMNPDFDETAGTVMFDGQANPGVRTATFNVTVFGDEINEPSESFTAVLSALSLMDGSAIADDTGLVTILDNDPLVVSAVDVTLDEDMGPATFTVTFDVPSEQSIIVNYGVTTVGVAGDPAEPADYDSAASGSLVFVPMDQSESFTVAVTDDNVNEAVEQFIATLTFVGAPDNATISTPSVTATINDNDMITVDVDGGLSVSEDVGTANVNVQLTNGGMVGATEQTIVVDLTTADSMTAPLATAGATTEFPTDYNPNSTALTFNSGTAQQNFPVMIVDESAGMEVNEAVEFFDVILSNSTPLPNNVTLGVTRGTVTITDNDNVLISINPPPTNAVARTPAEQSGGGFTTFNFEVVLTGRTDQQINVNYRITSGGTNPATPGADFTESDNIIVFTQNPNLAMRTEQAPAQVLADNVNETDQTFRLIVTNAASLPARVTVAPAEAVATIFDDDDLQVQLANAAPANGVALESGAASFEVNFVSAGNMVTATEQTFSVVFNAVTGTDGNPANTTAADAGVDFDDAPQTVTVAGTPTAAVSVTGARAITVNIVNDTINEGTENFRGQITNLQPATVRGITIDGANDTTTQTITDDDEIHLAVRPAAMSVVESAGVFTFEVFAENPGVGPRATGVTQDFSFDFATMDGVLTGGLRQAAAGADYTPLTVAPNNVTADQDFGVTPVVATFNVTINDDQINEALEGFLGTIANAMGELVQISATMNANTAEAQINDNDLITFAITADMSPILEGDTNGTVEAMFTITRTSAMVSQTEQAFDLNNVVTAGTATQGEDYTPPNVNIESFDGTMTVADVLPGGTTTLAVPIVSDDVNEMLNENFTVGLVISPVLANVTVGAPANQDIQDDDLLVLSLQVDQATGEESVSPRTYSLLQGAGNAATATRQTFMVNFTTTDGTATSVAPVDFTAPVGATFDFTGAPGADQPTTNPDLAMLTNTVAINDDSINEADEQFTANIAIAGLVSNVAIDVGMVTNTITDLDDPIELELVLVTPAGYSESAGGPLPGGTLVDVFTVRNSNGAVTDTEQNFQVIFNTSDDIATSVIAGPTPQDFLAVVNNTLNFGPATLSRTQQIAIIADTINELDEDFQGIVTEDGMNMLPANVHLGTRAAPLANLTVDAVILDDDNLVLRINNVAVTSSEGDPGDMNTLNFVIVSDSGAINSTEQDFFVSFETLAAISTPMATAAVDYVVVAPPMNPAAADNANGVYKVPTGSAISISTPVQIIEEDLNEPAEFVGARTIAVTQGGGPNPGTRGVSVNMTQVDGQIVDDDPVEVVFDAGSVAVSQTENDDAVTPQTITFNIDLIEPGMPAVAAMSQEDITVALNTDTMGFADGLDMADFSLPASFTLNAGLTTTSFDMMFNGDDINEANEQLRILLGLITTASSGVSVGTPGSSVFTGNDDDVVVLEFLGQNNRTLFERGNSTAAGTGAQVVSYVVTVDAGATMASTSEQLIRVVSTYVVPPSGMATQAVTNGDFTVAVPNGVQIAASSFLLGQFDGTGAAFNVMDATFAASTMDLTVNDEGTAAVTSGNEPDESFRFTTSIQNAGGGAVQNVSFGTGTTLDGTVEDVALLNLNGATTGMGLATTPRTIVANGSRQADVFDIASPAEVVHNGANFDGAVNSLIISISGDTVAGDTITLDGGANQVTLQPTGMPNVFNLRSVAQGMDIGQVDLTNNTVGVNGATVFVVCTFTNGVDPTESDMRNLVNQIRVTGAAGAHTPTLGVQLTEDQIPGPANEIRNATLQFAP